MNFYTLRKKVTFTYETLVNYEELKRKHKQKTQKQSPTRQKHQKTNLNTSQTCSNP